MLLFSCCLMTTLPINCLFASKKTLLFNIPYCGSILKIEPNLLKQIMQMKLCGFFSPCHFNILGAQWNFLLCFLAVQF